mgnify:CR=1 FL=1
MPFHDYDRPADRTELAFWAGLFLILAMLLLLTAPGWVALNVGGFSAGVGLWFLWRVLIR